MILFLLILIAIFFYAVWIYWQKEDLSYMQIVNDDFKEKYQRILIEANKRDKE